MFALAGAAGEAGVPRLPRRRKSALTARADAYHGVGAGIQRRVDRGVRACSTRWRKYIAAQLTGFPLSVCVIRRVGPHFRAGCGIRGGGVGRVRGECAAAAGADPVPAEDGSRYTPDAQRRATSASARLLAKLALPAMLRDGRERAEPHDRPRAGLGAARRAR